MAWAASRRSWPFHGCRRPTRPTTGTPRGSVASPGAVRALRRRRAGADHERRAGAGAAAPAPSPRRRNSSRSRRPGAASRSRRSRPAWGSPAATRCSIRDAGKYRRRGAVQLRFRGPVEDQVGLARAKDSRQARHGRDPAMDLAQATGAQHINAEAGTASSSGQGPASKKTSSSSWPASRDPSSAAWSIASAPPSRSPRERL